MACGGMFQICYTGLWPQDPCSETIKEGEKISAKKHTYQKNRNYESKTVSYQKVFFQRDT